MTKRQKKTLRKEKTFAWVFVVGMIIVGTLGVQRRLYQRSLALPNQVQASYNSGGGKPSDYAGMPVKMEVEGKLETIVEAASLSGSGFWVSEAGASYLIESARLGEKGNVILYGHNKDNLLGSLRQVKVGEQVRVEGSDGRLYVYEVESVQAVDPDEVKWLEQSDQAVLTAYTCTGFLDSQRFVVRAKLVEASS